MSVTDVSNSGHAAQSLGQASAKGDQKLSPFIFLFLLSLIIPFFIYAGPVRLSVYRIVLLVSFIPALTFLLSGKAGRIILPDICVMVICVWSTISLIVHHGVGPMVEPVGILVLETMGAYLLGRCYVRSPEDLLAVVRVLFGICLLLAPFALIESLTDRNILLEIARKIGPALRETHTEKRFGLNRVQGPFDHPILFGRGVWRFDWDDLFHPWVRTLLGYAHGPNPICCGHRRPGFVDGAADRPDDTALFPALEWGYE